jgi:hypothetical protein
VNFDEATVRSKGGFRPGGGGAEPVRKVAHERQHFSGRRKIMPAAIGLGVAALIGIATGHVRVRALHHEPMQIADVGFLSGTLWRARSRTKAQCLEVIDCFEEILQRFAANRDPVLDRHPRFGGCQRIALDRVRRIGQFEVVGVVEVIEAVRGQRPEPVKLRLFGGDPLYERVLRHPQGYRRKFLLRG